MLKSFRLDLQSGTQGGLLRAARRAYGLALLALALPGGVFGIALLLRAAPPPPAAALWGLGALALVLSALTLHLARRAAWAALPQPGQLEGPPARQAALTAAIQAATATAIPFLMGCAFPRPWVALLGFWALALAVHVVVWRQLPGWVQGHPPDRAGEHRAGAP